MKNSHPEISRSTRPMERVNTAMVSVQSSRSTPNLLFPIRTSLLPRAHSRLGPLLAPSISADCSSQCAMSTRSIPMFRSTSCRRSNRNFCCMAPEPPVGCRFATRTVMGVSGPTTQSSKALFRGCSAVIPMPKVMHSVNKSRATCARCRALTVRVRGLLHSVSASRSTVTQLPRSAQCRLVMLPLRSTG